MKCYLILLCTILQNIRICIPLCQVGHVLFVLAQIVVTNHKSNKVYTVYCIISDAISCLSHISIFNSLQAYTCNKQKYGLYNDINCQLIISKYFCQFEYYRYAKSACLRHEYIIKTYSGQVGYCLILTLENKRKREDKRCSNQPIRNLFSVRIHLKIQFRRNILIEESKRIVSCNATVQPLSVCLCVCWMFR